MSTGDCPPRRNESDAWLDTYADERQKNRRRRQMPGKLALLGVTAATDRRLKIADLCCGHGETLDCLHSLGFRHLHGIDLSAPPELVADPRFRVTTGDVRNTGYPDASFDWAFCIHSLHHLASAENAGLFLDEAFRLLKPGGRLSIIDFPASPQIRAAFWFFRRNIFLVTPYLKWFGKITQEEWWFLKDYLPQWAEVRRRLYHGRFEVERSTGQLFYFYLTLRKPV